MEATEEKYVEKVINEEDGCSNKPLHPSPPIRKVGECSEIIEETTSSQQAEPRNLVVEIPKITFESSTEESVKRVNFSPLRSPSYAKFSGSSSPSSSVGKSSLKSLLPKLSFKLRNTNSEIKEAAILALGCSPSPQEKSFIPRTFSLTKLFTLKTKKTSSLPVTPIAHSNPESTHGGNTVDLQSYLRLQAILLVLLAAFAGFGGAMCGNCVLLEFLKLRRRWLAWSNQQRDSHEARRAAALRF